jgi:hypothetical protein
MPRPEPGYNAQHCGTQFHLLSALSQLTMPDYRAHHLYEVTPRSSEL